MLSAALDQDAELVIKGHPDVSAGFAKGHLAALSSAAGIPVLNDDVSMDSLLDAVDEVWTVSSQFGLEALLRGSRVISFGMPAYSGWGLCEDRAAGCDAEAARRRRRRNLTIDEFVAAAFIRYPIYFDPVAGRRVPVEAAVERLLSWRRHARSRLGQYVCTGFSFHKRDVARLFLQSPWSTVSFRSGQGHSASRKPGERSVFWGPRPAAADRRNGDLCIEDGFIRSTGLGSNKVRPKSLCIDATGIYYDATHASDLETILNDTIFDDALLARGARLRAAIVRGNVTKYNQSTDKAPLIWPTREKKVVLVAEQVPDDASLRFGLPIFRSNLELLAAVKAARPEAFVVYKQHPDLLSGRRRGGGAVSELSRYADAVLGNVDLASCGRISMKSMLRHRNWALKRYCEVSQRIVTGCRFSAATA